MLTPLNWEKIDNYVKISKLKGVVNMFTSYQEMYYSAKSMDFIARKRLDMVHMAFDAGYKATARYFNTDRNTVRKWCRRYALEGIKGLYDRNKKPLHSPNKIDQKAIDKIENVCKWAVENGKYITVKNVRKKTKIKEYSDVTISRYINKALKNKKSKKKNDKTNGGSILFKEFLKPFEIIQIDIKYLTDIDNLKPYFENQNLVKYQITARDVLTGFPIVAYCYEKSSDYTTMFLEKVLVPFLKQFKYLDFRDIVIQTDNGPEFTNKYIRTKDGHEAKDTTFTIFIAKRFKKHRTNIPGHCTANSEVESFHWSIERDCLAWDDIYNNKSLLNCVEKYINVYVHTKIHRKGYSPYQKIKETLKVKAFKVPKPTILTYKDKQ